MKKIKVLHVIKSLGRGGAEMLLPETLKLHDKTVFDFHYIYFLPWKDQLVREIKDNGGLVTCIPAKNNLQLIQSSDQIKEYCRKHNIDLIHAHLPWAGFVARRVFKRTGIPVIYSEHNMQERYHFLTKMINKYTFNNQSLAIGVSQDVSDSIQKNIHPAIPVKTILNGVNTDAFSTKLVQPVIRLNLEIPQDAIVVGLVAVFRFQKRIKEWLEVLKHATDNNSLVYGIIVGAGPLENEIKQHYEDLGLKGKVIFVGLQENTKPYYEAMDIFMMTSSFEGLPIALLEAMSMECAIVTTDAGGIKEVIRNELDGLMVPVNQWNELADYIIELENDRDRLEELKKSARIRVQDSFSLNTMISELENSYKNLIYDHSGSK